MKETFKLRNIFCHEAAESHIVDIPEIYKCFESAKKFLEASNKFIWKMVEPNHPMGTYGWQFKLGQELEKLNIELETLILKITQTDESMKIDFWEIHKAWEYYKDARREIVSKQWAGGTGQMSAELSEEIYLTKARIEEVKEEIKLGKYAACPH